MFPLGSSAHKTAGFRDTDDGAFYSRAKKDNQNSNEVTEKVLLGPLKYGEDVSGVGSCFGWVGCTETVLE